MSNPLLTKFIFMKSVTPYSKKFKTKNRHSVGSKCFKRLGFCLGKSFFDYSSLICHHSKHESLNSDYFYSIIIMEDILAMVGGPSALEISNFDQIDQNFFAEFLEKSSVWDFYEMSKEEYLNKDES